MTALYLSLSPISQGVVTVFTHLLWVSSGDRGPVWLCQTGHGGTWGCDAGCRLAHGRFQDAQLSGHQMGPQCSEGTLCNHTQGIRGGLIMHCASCDYNSPPFSTFLLPFYNCLFNSHSPRPYAKLWRSGKIQETPQERDGGAGPPLSAATLIFILSVVNKLFNFSLCAHITCYDLCTHLFGRCTCSVHSA